MLAAWLTSYSVVRRRGGGIGSAWRLGRNPRHLASDVFVEAAASASGIRRKLWRLLTAVAGWRTASQNQARLRRRGGRIPMQPKSACQRPPSSQSGQYHMRRRGEKMTACRERSEAFLKRRLAAGCWLGPVES